MLDAILGNAIAIESVGELVSGMGRYNDLCSCGKSFTECKFWQSVRGDFEDKSGETWDDAVLTSTRQAHISMFIKTLLSSEQDKWIQKLIQHSQYIAEAVTKNGSQIIVDSSKEITRALFFIRFMKDARIIYLVRNPVNILASDYHRLTNGIGFKFLRYKFSTKGIYWPFLLISCIGWMVGNMLSEIIRMFGRDRFLLVKYENIIREPIAEFERIERFIGVSLEQIMQRLKNNGSFNVGHNIGGNRMRMEGNFRFDPGKSSRNVLPQRYRIMAQIICFPLMIYYGYRME
jgi:hypothetical protein